MRKSNQSITKSSYYDLDRQTAKISVLSTGNVNKYEFVTG